MADFFQVNLSYCWYWLKAKLFFWPVHKAGEVVYNRYDTDNPPYLVTLESYSQPYIGWSDDNDTSGHWVIDEGWRGVDNKGEHVEVAVGYFWIPYNPNYHI
jgi:hypothetical protein